MSLGKDSFLNPPPNPPQDDEETRRMKDRLFMAEAIQTSNRIPAKFDQGIPRNEQPYWKTDPGGKEFREIETVLDSAKVSEHNLPSVFYTPEEIAAADGKKETVRVRWRATTADHIHALKSDGGYVLLYVTSGNQSRVIVFDTETNTFHWNSKKGPELPEGAEMAGIKTEYRNPEDQEEFESQMRRLGR